MCGRSIEGDAPGHQPGEGGSIPTRPLGEIRLLENKKDVHPLLLGVHYARSIPSISYAFGLFREGQLKGCTTFGMPPSPTLRIGIAGKGWAPNILELNRLVLVENNPNEASYLVGRSIKMLPKPRIIVSYSDMAQGHEGIVYRAANFLYNGLIVNNRPCYKLHSAPDLDHVSVCDRYRTAKGRKAPLSFGALQDFFGEDVYKSKFSSKHRYLYLHGSKSDRRRMRAALKYDILPWEES